MARIRNPLSIASQVQKAQIEGKHEDAAIWIEELARLPIPEISRDEGSPLAGLLRDIKTRATFLDAAFRQALANIQEIRSDHAEMRVYDDLGKVCRHPVRQVQRKGF